MICISFKNRHSITILLLFINENKNNITILQLFINENKHNITNFPAIKFFCERNFLGVLL